MASFPKLALLVILAGALISLPDGVNAIKCFKCDNHNGPRDVELLCDPPSPTDSERVTECDSGVCVQTSWFGKGLKCDGCIYRMCGHPGVPNGCEKSEGVDPRDNVAYVMNQCHCNTELCNAFDPFTAEERKSADHVLDKPYKGGPKKGNGALAGAVGTTGGASNPSAMAPFEVFVISIMLGAGVQVIMTFGMHKYLH